MKVDIKFHNIFKAIQFLKLNPIL